MPTFELIKNQLAMKKLFLSLAFVLPLTFISCEEPVDDDSNNDGSTQNDGFWDVDCYQTYDSIATTSCDSIWVNDSSNATYQLQCDSVLVYDSIQNPYWDVDCKQVLVSVQGGHYVQDCKTTYSAVLVEVCDSTWVEDQTDSTNSGNNGANQGYWDYQCDSTFQQGTYWEVKCDSVWVN